MSRLSALKCEVTSKDSKSEVKLSRQMRLAKLTIHIIFFNLVITCKQSRILAVLVLWSARQSRFT